MEWIPLLGGLDEGRVGGVAERAGHGGALPGADEVGGGDEQADGALGDGGDLRGEVLAEVGRGAAEVHLQLPRQLLDVAQLRHHQPAASIAVDDAGHRSTDESLLSVAAAQARLEQVQMAGQEAGPQDCVSAAAGRREEKRKRGRWGGEEGNWVCEGVM